MSRFNSLSQYQTKMANQTQRTSVFSQSTATPLSRTNQINDIIVCLICSDSIRQSHMCPSCCKMFCQSCIKDYIKIKKSQCPSCLKPLNLSNLLNCSILGSQIQQALSKSVHKMKSPVTNTLTIISPSNSKFVYPKKLGQTYQPLPVKTNDILCQKHQLKLDYYCEQCCIGLCSDCAVLSDKHQGHRICKIIQKKLKFKQKLSETQKNLTILKDKAIKLKQQANKALKNSRSIQIQKINVLHNYLKNLNGKNTQEINNSLKDQQQKLLRYLQNLQEFQTKYSQIQNKIKKQTKAWIVNNSTNISSQILEILKNYQQQPIVPMIPRQNFLVPKFKQKTYILDNYNYLRQKGDVLISQPLFCKGTQWRLKIFPGGINYLTNKRQNQYLAIHVQLSQGYTPSNIYRFRLELVNQANRQECISYQYQNQFKPGQVWCIDNFIQIPALYQQNFINIQQGYIQIVLYVRCLTYYHTILDQQQLINLKQQAINKNNIKIDNLRKQAIQKKHIIPHVQKYNKIQKNRPTTLHHPNRAIDQDQ